MVTVVRCPDCSVLPGEEHALAVCDVAVCLATGHQRYGCPGNDGPPDFVVHDCGRDVWTGERTALAAARDLGLWAAYRKPESEGVSPWVPCSPDTPGALPSVNRVLTEAVWSRQDHRWVLPVEGDA